MRSRVSRWDWSGLPISPRTVWTRLVFFEETCGASTCWDRPHVWHWVDGAFVELMPPHVEYPSAEMTLEGNRLVIVSYGFGSVGAGPQRTLTETWQWTGDAMTVTGRSQSPPGYLIDLFLDGDAALKAKDYDAAFAAFSRLVHENDDLATASWSYDAVEERAWFVALAHWRLLTLDTLLGTTPCQPRVHLARRHSRRRPDLSRRGRVARASGKGYREVGQGWLIGLAGKTIGRTGQSHSGRWVPFLQRNFRVYCAEANRRRKFWALPRPGGGVGDPLGGGLLLSVGGAPEKVCPKTGRSQIKRV